MRLGSGTRPGPRSTVRAISSHGRPREASPPRRRGAASAVTRRGTSGWRPAGRGTETSSGWEW